MLLKGILITLLVFSPFIISVAILLYALYCWYVEKSFFGYNPEDFFYNELE